jgi:2-polyprenyl-3-methyl-5-hydroxy-6-metoxy-1,4-benzoquinol methylase
LDKAYWNSVADRFDDEVLKILDRDRNNTLSSAISKISSRKKTVADFGCGNGSLLPVLSGQFREVQAIDYSPKLLADAESRCKTATNISYQQADLSSPFRIHRKVDILLCVNVIIQPDSAIRDSILQNAFHSLKRRGKMILVVPSYESLFHTYQTIVEANVAMDVSRKTAIAEVESIFREEVISPIDGIVSLGSVPTKMHTQTEIQTALEDLGMKSISIQRIEYDWAEMIDDAPKGLGGPYPWDWLAVARKP